MTNRTLVFLMGNLRCGELAWESLYRNLLDVNMADLAILTQPVNTSVYPDPSLLHRAKYVWSVPFYHDWADAVDLMMNISSGWRDIVPNLVSRPDMNQMLGGIGNHTGSNVILGMNKWWVKQLVERHELTARYDRFVITRNDQYYTCPYQVNHLDPNHAWVPKGEDWGGINDRFYVVGADKVLSSLNVLEPILRHTNAYKWLYQRDVWFTNSEYILKKR